VIVQSIPSITRHRRRLAVVVLLGLLLPAMWAASAQATVTATYDADTQRLTLLGDDGPQLLTISSQGTDVKVHSNSGISAPMCDVSGGVQAICPGPIAEVHVQLVGDHDDTVNAQSLTNGTRLRVEAAGGEDTITGGTADDILDGGPDRDIIEGSDGNDVIYGRDGNDTLRGNSGRDHLYPGTGGGSVDGGGSAGDFDLVRFDDVTESVTVDLTYGVRRATIGSESVGLFNIHGAVGGPGDDTLIGDAGNNLLDGGPGNDTINGANGNDELRGGPGDDTLTGGNGDDILMPGTGGGQASGGDGSDVISFAGETVPVRVDLRDGTVAIDGQTQTFSGIEHAAGGEGDDTLLGSEAGDRLSGNGGDDVLDGRGGPDTLDGGDGNDRLLALTTDGAADVLRGGDGDDVINAADRDAVDEIDCGPGDDTADHDIGEASVTGCETARERPADWAGDIAIDPPARTPTNETTLAFTFTTWHPQLDPPTVECRLDEGDWRPCASPATFSDVGEGTHAHEVRLTDAQGDTAIASSEPVTVDTTAPTVTLSAPAQVGAGDERAQIAFTASEPDVTFECGTGPTGGWAPCTSPHTVALPVGDTVVRVRATDQAGNTGQATATIRRTDPSAPRPQPDDPSQPAPQPGEPSQPAPPPAPGVAPGEPADAWLRITGLSLSGRRLTLTATAPAALRSRTLAIRERAGGRTLARVRVPASGRLTARFTLTARRTAVIELDGRTIAGPLTLAPAYARLAVSGSGRTVRLTGRLAGAGRTTRVTIQRTADGRRWTTATTITARKGRLDTRLRLPAGTKAIRLRARTAGRTVTSIALAVPGA
jgi:Ca2+-binding RTX toxin-like protein